MNQRLTKQAGGRFTQSIAIDIKLGFHNKKAPVRQ